MNGKADKYFPKQKKQLIANYPIEIINFLNILPAKLVRQDYLDTLPKPQ